MEMVVEIKTVTPDTGSPFYLTASEKLQLVEDLWDELAATPAAIPLYDWQKDELVRRKANLANNPDAGSSWEDVKARIGWGISMSTSPSKALATRLRFDADSLWVELSDGRQLGVPLAYFPRLLGATPAQRERYVISGGGMGLHWDDLDEDISVEGLLQGIPDRTRR